MSYSAENKKSKAALVTVLPSKPDSTTNVSSSSSAKSPGLWQTLVTRVSSTYPVGISVSSTGALHVDPRKLLDSPAAQRQIDALRQLAHDAKKNK